MEFKDYYATLGVARTATDKEIKQAFRRLARKFHPDVNPGDKAAETRFKELNEAYEVLGDPAKRKKYDDLGANWRLYEEAAARGGGFGQGGPFAGGQWTTAGPGGFRSMTEEEVREMFGEADPFSDFFRTFFGGEPARGGSRRGRGGQARSRRGRDVESELHLTLQEAFSGVQRRVPTIRAGQPATVDVRIPAGVDDGSVVRVAGEGEAGTDGAPAGDLYFLVRIAPDPRFDRRGADLYTRVALPVTTAVLGGEAEVMTVGGRPVRLRVPEGTQSGQVFRLKGQGMPRPGRASDRGDLYATVDVELPRRLSAEERKHYEALQRLQGKAGR
jgi:DnaJ-class molecular chaperone